MTQKKLNQLTTATLLFALFVILLGAYTRLTDAGLGCPDWPACYGHWISNTLSKQAWTEMIHRYAAGTFGFLLIGLSICFFIYGDSTEKRCMKLILMIVIFQAMLGMWTVTLKLLPIVVMSHLIGGFLLFGLLSYVRARSFIEMNNDATPYHTPPAVLIGIFLLFIQIALGGWVSTNYAGIACNGFPLCNGWQLPPLALSEAFSIIHHFGENHQGGLLSIDARMTIQLIHRLGALIVLTYWSLFIIYFLKQPRSNTQKILGILIPITLMLQCIVGIINVIDQLPLSMAVTHNGIAAVLWGLSLGLLATFHPKKA